MMAPPGIESNATPAVSSDSETMKGKIAVAPPGIESNTTPAVSSESETMKGKKAWPRRESSRTRPRPYQANRKQ